MTDIRTTKEIAAMRASGALLSHTLEAVVAAVRPGITLPELDALAEKLLRAGGGTPSFKGYKSKKDDRPFPSTLCISVNDEVVHGSAARPVTLCDGDVVGLDIGVWLDGFCTDMAVTVGVGKTTHAAQQLMEVTKQSMLKGLAAVHDDASVSAIGRSVEAYVKPYHYGVVRDLVGHGVGKKVHEDPHIPNYYDARYDSVKLKAGMTIAVEPMLAIGDWRVRTLDDGWTIATVDGSLAAHFEVTVLVTKDGYEFITPMVL